MEKIKEETNPNSTLSCADNMEPLLIIRPINKDAAKIVQIVAAFASLNGVPQKEIAEFEELGKLILKWQRNNPKKVGIFNNVNIIKLDKFDEINKSSNPDHHQTPVQS